MLTIRVRAPDAISHEDHEHMVSTLIQVGDFTKTQAKSLLSALLDMKLDSFEISDGTQAKLQTLRNARLLVELINPDPEDEADEDEDDGDEVTDEEVWEAWTEA